MPTLPCDNLDLAWKTWAWFVREPKDFRIPHSLPESNQYPFNHEGCWNGELVALGYCSHIPKDTSWTVKNQSEPNEPFSECFDSKLLWWRHNFSFACSEFSQLKSKSWFFAWSDWDSSLLNLDVPRSNISSVNRWTCNVCVDIVELCRAPEWFIWGHLFPTPR